jgi:hypothetical protein
LSHTVYMVMHLFSTIGAWIMLPFIAFSGFFGMYAAAPMQPAPVPSGQATSSPTNSSTTTIGFESPAHPQKPVNLKPVASSTSAVELDSVSPLSGAVGDTITLVGSGFTADNKVLLNGALAASNVHLSSFTNGHQTLTFTIPSSMGADCKAGQPCPMYAILVTPRAYTVAVENENGVSNELNLTVVGNALIPPQQ